MALNRNALLVVALSVGMGCPAVRAATAKANGTPAASALVPGLSNHPSNATAALLPPEPLPPKSPVDNFRELLAMDPAERKKAIADRPAEIQKQILAKIREYESMSAEQQKLRLRATELQWFLVPLMRAAPSNRVDRLKQLSPENRELLESRLAAWDKLSPAVQQELLDNEATLRYFTELDVSSPNISEARRKQLDKGIASWRALPEDQRRRIAQRFTEFFELTPAEKERALQTVSDAERRQMEKTLRRFSKLTPPQRAQCVKSFEKFASLSLAERQQFLKNAERWKLMTPSERESWRHLVERLEQLPPLPQSVVRPPPPPPPQPSRFAPRSGVARTN